MLWLRYFSGSEELINANAVIGKKVTISYQITEIYSPEAKEYFGRKEVTGVSFE